MIDRINTLFARAYLATRDEDGQTIAEYALVLALVAIMAIGGLMLLSGGINTKLDYIRGVLTGGGGSSGS